LRLTFSAFNERFDFKRDRVEQFACDHLVTGVAFAGKNGAHH
jgi:hypothetical protein